MPKSEHIAKCVAEWMAGKFNRQRELYQSDAVSGIIKNFGKEFIYTNDDGYECIRKDVLTEFRALTPDCKWVGGGKYWRKAEGQDLPGRRGG